MKSICISTVFSRRRRRWLFLVSFRIVVVVVALVVGALQLCRAVGGCKSSETVKVQVLAGGVLLSFMNIL